MSEYTDMPKIVKIEGKTDAGEFGAARCPHCGAEGRYIYWFVCEDGTKRGAMAGCFKKWPQHPFAGIHAKLLDKQADYAKKNWKLPSWDLIKLEALDKFYAREIPEVQAWGRIKDANFIAKKYRANRFGRR